MPQMNNVYSKKELTVFFISDTCGQEGNPMCRSLNQSMNACVDTIKEIAKNKGISVDIKKVFIAFDLETGWDFSDDSVKIEWINEDTSKADNCPDFNLISNNLKDAINCHITYKSDAFMPVFIFLSFGQQPSDEWNSALENVKENPFFKYGIRIAVTDVDSASPQALQMLSESTGSSEAIIGMSDVAQLKNLLAFKTMEDVNEAFATSVLYLKLPNGEVAITEDEVTIYQCQLQKCFPEDAMKPCLKVIRSDDENKHIYISGI